MGEWAWGNMSPACSLKSWTLSLPLHVIWALGPTLSQLQAARQSGPLCAGKTDGQEVAWPPTPSCYPSQGRALSGVLAKAE